MDKDECCPEFKSAIWDDKTFEWKNKPFIKESIPTLFHMPFPPMIGKKVTKMWKLIQDGKAQPPKEDWLLLFYDPSPFKSDMYMSCTKSVNNADNTTISGTFMAKVFDGPYNAIPKFIKEMDAYLSKKDKNANKYYVHYAYCPKCSKNFGHNYMILFAEVN